MRKKLSVAAFVAVVLSLGVIAGIAVAAGNGDKDKGGTDTCQPGEHAVGDGCVHNGDGATARSTT